MLVPGLLKTILLFGGLAIAGLGVLFYIAGRDEKDRRDAENLPTAKLVGKDPCRAASTHSMTLYVMSTGN